MPARNLEDELHRLLARYEENPSGRLFAPLADCYRKLGRLEEAYRLCVDGLARHPDYSSGFVILGRIHLDRGEDEEARTALETVLSLDPENLVALRGLEQLAQRRGDPEEVERYRKLLLELDPQAESDSREEAPWTDGEEEPAEVLMASAGEESAESPPEDAQVLTAVSRNEDLQNDPKDFDPEGIFEGQTIVTVTLADVYYEQGFKAKALEMYRSVLQRHPDAPGVAAKVAAIEDELSRLKDRFQADGSSALEEKVENLETPPEPKAARPSEEQSPEQAGEPDQGGPEGEDERRFRSWVEKRHKGGA